MGFDGRHELDSPSGAKIGVLRREAEGVPRAVVHISHGFGEDGLHFVDFADDLAARGFHVYAHDHRGHGATRAPDALPGHFGSGAAAEKVLADMGAVQDFIAGRHPGLPVMLFGHAEGVPVALDFFLWYPDRVAGLAFDDPPALRTGPGRRILLAWERFRLGSDVPSRIMTPAAARPEPPASIGSRLAIAAIQDRLSRRRDIASGDGRVPVLIRDGGGSDRNGDALARWLRTMGFSGVILLRKAGAVSGDDIAAVFRNRPDSGLD